LRPRRRKPPIARRRCLRPAAGHPSSAKDPSAIWTRGRARRPFWSVQQLRHWNSRQLH